MTEDPVFLIIFGIALAIVFIGLLLKIFNQPHVITYIIVGVILGPSFFGIISDQNLLLSLGSIGVVLLMFFVGMEVSIPRLVSNWKIVSIGPLLQVVVATVSMLIFGKFFDWPLSQSILMAFVITVSSTAVVIKILQSWEELNTKIGQDVMGILIVQDIMVVPMLLIISVTSSKGVDLVKTLESTVTGVLIIALILYMIKKGDIKIPFNSIIKKDPELKFFIGLVICFGFVILISSLGLSGALGAFIAGILLSGAKDEYSMTKNLKPFYFFFMAIFFISIGMLLDIDYIKSHLILLSILVIIVFILNMVINTLIMKLLGRTWRESLFAGALLSQLGEFGFVFAAAGLGVGIITNEGYALIIALISLTLILSPFWILFIKKTLDNEKIHIRYVKDSFRKIIRVFS